MLIDDGWDKSDGGCTVDLNVWSWKRGVENEEANSISLAKAGVNVICWLSWFCKKNRSKSWVRSFELRGLCGRCNYIYTNHKQPPPGWFWPLLCVMPQRNANPPISPHKSIPPLDLLSSSSPINNANTPAPFGRIFPCSNIAPCAI